MAMAKFVAALLLALIAISMLQTMVGLSFFALYIYSIMNKKQTLYLHFLCCSVYRFWHLMGMEVITMTTTYALSLSLSLSHPKLTKCGGVLSLF
jgi:hypothetical protein